MYLKIVEVLSHAKYIYRQGPIKGQGCSDLRKYGHVPNNQAGWIFLRWKINGHMIIK